MNVRAPSTALPPGTDIGGYEVVRELGRGGFGVTYEAVNTLGDRVAVKEFFPLGIASRDGSTQVTLDEESQQIRAWALDRFKRSTVDLRKLSHPNIVRVLHYVPGQDTGFMIMEFVPGRTLASLLDKAGGSIPLARLRPWFEPALDALAYVHSCGVLHRDVAPDNVMVREDGTPVLIDFGAMKSIERQVNATRVVAERTYATVKAHYSSPEQQNPNGELTPAADVYSAAAVIYRALVGRAPADAGTRMDRFLFGGADPYEPVARVAQHPIDPGAAATIDRALTLRPQDRVPTIAELRAGLGWSAGVGDVTAIHEPPAIPASDPRRAAAAGYGVAAAAPSQPAPSQPAPPQVVTPSTVPPAGPGFAPAPFAGSYPPPAPNPPSFSPGWAPPVAPPARARHSGLLVVAALTALSALVGAGVYFVRPPTDAAGPDVQRGGAIVDPAARGGAAAGGPGASSLSVASGASTPDAGAAPALAGPARVLEQTGHGEGVNAVAFSGDGAFVVSGGGDAVARLWHLGSGLEVRRFSGHALAVFSTLLTRDGRGLFTGSQDRTIRLWDVASGAEVRRFEGHADTVHGLALTADGRTLVSTSRDRTVRVWDVATGRELRRFDGHGVEVYAAAITPDGTTVFSAGRENAIRAWDLATAREIRRLVGHTSAVYDVSMSSDGRFLFSASADRTVRQWETGGVAALHTLEGHANFVYSVSASADGRVVASGGADRTVAVWTLPRRTRVQTPDAGQAHTGDVLSVAASADGARIASASTDRTVRVWDAATARPVLTLGGRALSARLALPFYDEAGGRTEPVVAVTCGSSLLPLPNDAVRRALHRPDLVRAAAAADGAAQIARARAEAERSLCRG